MKKYPLIFDIARASLEDGKGIRTVIFFKGCSLRCVWCHNPESWKIEKEYFNYPERCIDCGYCENECYSKTKEEIGFYKDTDDLINEILKDKMFYESSGGGVTLSGGEPLLWPDYVKDLTNQLKEKVISINIETSGYFNFNDYGEAYFNLIDTVFFDFKIFDKDLHKKYTGKSNKIILSNLNKLSEMKINLVPRITLVPDIVANKNNLKQIAETFNAYKIKNYKILSYNNSYNEKHKRLSYNNFNYFQAEPMKLEEELEWKKYFEKCINSI